MDARPITERQREILNLAALGKTDKQIGIELGIGTETVQSHWKSLRERFDQSSRSAILAQVLIEQSFADRVLLQSERDELLFQLGQCSQLRLELERVNRKLKSVLDHQAEFLAKSMSAQDKANALLQARVEELTELEKLVERTNTLIHAGEYGSTWRKSFMSSSIKFTGTIPFQWTSGEVNFMDYVYPEYLARNLSKFAPFSPGSHRVAMTYLAKGSETDRYFLDMLYCDILGSDGIGTYYGVSVDITDFVDQLDEMAQDGQFRIEKPI